MTERDEHRIKVVDRRRWANVPAEGTDAPTAPSSSSSLKPTFVEELEQRLADREREAQEYLAKYRQASAEFDEARLRLRREISKDIERARRDVLAEMLEVLDNLDRALESGRGQSSLDALLTGVEMVRRQFVAKLDGLGVTRIDAEGHRFDPALHEAISTVPAASSDQDGLIVGIIRQGYRIGDDVLRPAAVAVGKT